MKRDTEQMLTSPSGTMQLTEILRDSVVREVEKRLMDEVMPLVKAKVKEAAAAACVGLKANIETMRDMRDTSLQMRVTFNDRTIDLDAPKDTP